MHNRLWAPWRLGYITGSDSPAASSEAVLAWRPGADRSCFLCRAVADSADRENFVVRRGESTIVVLNRYPYNNGHLLVAPERHVGDLPLLADAEHLAMQREIARFTQILAERMNAEGFNVGLNLGRVAGAGLPGHLHWHIVPRWHGDTNFMSSVDAIRVIPQALDELWTMLGATLETKPDET